RREYMVLSTRLKDERMEGRKEGREEGRIEERRNIALELLKEKDSLAKIMKLTSLRKEEVYALAQANGLEVVE
ncbi:MAG: hypothetical protein Q4E64_10265, partial [Phascolarctobacterium sp.]|nr:hypothetical protein [Phascolarctobacterium sp.]